MQSAFVNPAGAFWICASYDLDTTHIPNCNVFVCVCPVTGAHECVGAQSAQSRHLKESEVDVKCLSWLLPIYFSLIFETVSLREPEAH